MLIDIQYIYTICLKSHDIDDQRENTICLGSAFVRDELEMQDYLGVLAWIGKISGTATSVLSEVLKIERAHRIGAKNGTFFSKSWVFKILPIRMIYKLLCELETTCRPNFEEQISRNWNLGVLGTHLFHRNSVYKNHRGPNLQKWRVPWE